MVVRQIDGAKAAEGEDRGREPAAEAVAAEKDCLEVSQRREVRNGASERVVLETKNPKLVEAVESTPREEPGEASALEYKADDAAGGRAGDSRPSAVCFGGIVCQREKGQAVPRVGDGLEGEERRGVSRGSSGGTGEEEEEEEQRGAHRDGGEPVASSPSSPAPLVMSTELIIPSIDKGVCCASAVRIVTGHRNCPTLPLFAYEASLSLSLSHGWELYKLAFVTNGPLHSLSNLKFEYFRLKLNQPDPII